MILSPHPDDESITGSLALRLLQENNAHIVNVAVTIGSNKERQKQRVAELNEATSLLEMECLYLNEDWEKKAQELTGLIEKYAPDLLIAPHSEDFHPVHIKTNELLKTVLGKLDHFTALVAWSEFWAPMSSPNLLLEVPVEILELQMRALEKHAGEIARNPYHLRLPAWMMDNVRRGSEIIGGKGTQGAQMPFGVLYKLELFGPKGFTTLDTPSVLEAENNLAQIFKLMLERASGSKTIVR
jgi:LmbE family N-acetylglucosaminyl deacetylase